jgi:hypothetical protein
VPGPAAVDVEARIAELVERHRAELEQLVRRALDLLVGLELQRLIGTGANGATPASSSATSRRREVPAGEPCSRCGAEPRLPGRTIGRAYKTADDVARARRRKRERCAPAAADDVDGPRKSSSAQPQ